MSKNYVITIARQFGSLGRDIAKMLADELDINYYDRDLLEKSGETLGIDTSSLSNYDETMGGHWAKMLYPLGLGSATTHNKLFEIQKSMILDLASNESCVIVGRCADYILKDHPNTLNVFIYAPYERRLGNCYHRLGLDRGDAAKMIEGVDKARNAYHRYYTGVDVDSIGNRHVMIDSSIMSPENTVNIIKQIAIKKLDM